MAKVILSLKDPALTGRLKPDTTSLPLPDSQTYIASATGDGLSWSIKPGDLANATHLAIDFLLDGTHLAVFGLSLHEPADKNVPARNFHFAFSLLNQCSARLRLPLEATNQNQWSFAREGACLKRMAGGDRVDPARVTTITLTLNRKSDQPVRFAATAVGITQGAPDLISQPLLPKGPLLDELGQSTLTDWAGKTKSVDEATARLKQQLTDAPALKPPAHFNRWGGHKASDAKPSGFFKTHHDGKRWWLIDPDGGLFWSAGMDAVRPDVDSSYQTLESALTFLPVSDPQYRAALGGRRGRSMNYLIANFIRAFGPADWEKHWATISLSLLRSWGFNTIANWSRWEILRDSAFPYVRPLSFSPRDTPRIYRDFPDVFSPTFEADAAAYARQLDQTKDDRALVGYFLMNEPTWGFSKETPAAGMLYTTASCHTRDHFATWLTQKYASDAALANAWNMPATFSSVASGKWTKSLTRRAQDDCALFSTLMADRLFATLSAACKKVDPNHLNLGARYHTTPPTWALKGMLSFDVFSINCYQERVPASQLKTITDTTGRPVIIGEYHFGALDAGLPATGIGHVPTQADRGRAFRVYTENAAALPQCVGVHYFTFYDQSALGRFDGENYNIGFLDVCNAPYIELSRAARASHELLYDVAAGKVAPYGDSPRYLPKLF